VASLPMIQPAMGGMELGGSSGLPIKSAGKLLECYKENFNPSRVFCDFLESSLLPVVIPSFSGICH
jgi:hypothetical protein